MLHKYNALVIGDMHPELKKALERARRRGLIGKVVVKFRETSKTDKEVITENIVKYVKSKIGLENFRKDWIVIKGKIHSADFLRVLIALDKEFLHSPKTKPFYSHVVVLENKRKHTKFCLTDGAFVLNPTQREMVNIYQNLKNFYQNLFGLKPSTEFYPIYILAENNENIPEYNKIKTLRKFVDTMQLDTFLSQKARKIKNIKSSHPYHRAIMVPNINVGNAIWKILTTMANFTAAGFVTGLNFVALLNSRGDSAASFYRSLELAKKIKQNERRRKKL